MSLVIFTMRRWVFAATIALAVQVGCNSSVPLYGLGCPCVSGYQCCDGACVSDGESCDGKGTTAQDGPIDETDPNIDSPSSAKGFPIDPEIRLLTTVDTPPSCVTSDADHVYFMDRKASVTGIAKVDGDAPARSRLSMPIQTAPICGVARDGSDLYATLFGSGTMAKLSVTKIGKVLAIGEKGFTFGALVTPSSVAVDETSVYVSERDSGVIKRFDKTTLGYDAPSAATGTVLGQGGPQPHDLIVDASDLFWVDSAGIRRMPKQGGSITTLTSSVGTQLKIADGALFWLGDAGIWSLSLTKAEPAARLHFIEQRARENWAKKRAREDSGASSSSASGKKTESIQDDIEDARDPEKDEDYAASFFQPTAFTLHEGVIYFASRLHVYAASRHGGDAARAFVYRQYELPRATPSTLSMFLAVDSARYIWATEGALMTRPR